MTENNFPFPSARGEVQCINTGNLRRYIFSAAIPSGCGVLINILISMLINHTKPPTCGMRAEPGSWGIIADD